MNTKEFRAAVFDKIQAWGAGAFPTMNIIYENGPMPDQSVISPIWLDVEIRWYGSQKLALGGPSRGRHSGAVSTRVYAREATGAGSADDVIDLLAEHLGSQRIGSAILNFPQRTVAPKNLGWYSTGLLFPFQLDT